MTIKEKLKEIFKDNALKNGGFLRSFVFYFLLNMQNKIKDFKLNIDTKCLVLSPYPSAELKGIGGIIAQNPKNFEILCLTNGSNMPDCTRSNPLIKKQQFGEIMKLLRVKGFKIFDIDSSYLKNHYSTFKKIDISEADYIFVPNVFDINIDTLSLLKHFKRLLEEKDYKEDLKIFMYECDYPLNMPNYIANISSIIETKRKYLNMYFPEEIYGTLTDKVLGLNAFRANHNIYNYCETLLELSVEEFLQIPML